MEHSCSARVPITEKEVVQLFLEMNLWMDEKVFRVEYYIRSCGSDERGPSLKYVAEHFIERFNKTAPSNTAVLSVVTKFRLIVVYCDNGRGSLVDQ
jgi:hypothetical protein